MADLELVYPAARTPAPVPWAQAVAVSLLAHAALGGVLFFGVRHIMEPTPTSLNTAMSVELMPMPAAPATPPSPEKPEPEPVEKQKPLDLPPLKIPDVKPDVVIPEKEQPKPERPPPPPPPTLSAPPARTAAAPVQGTPVQGISSIEQGYDAKLIARMESKKRYPLEAQRQRLEDVIYVRVRVDRRGQVMVYDIVRSKNIPMLDEAVRDMVKRSNPFPAMPAALPGNDYSFTVPVTFFISNKRR